MPGFWEAIIMTSMKKIFFLLSILSLVIPARGAAAAEGAVTYSSFKWQKTVEELKTKTDDLLKQNESLNQEYKFLQQKLSDLQISVKDLNKDVYEQEKVNEQLRQQQEERLKKQQDLKADAEKMRQDIQAAQNENERLNTLLTEEVEKTAAIRDKLAELSAKKREVMLDLKMQDINRQDLKADEETRLKKEQDRMEEIKKEEAALSQKVLELQKEEDSLLAQIDQFKKENRLLESKVAEFTKQKDGKMQENERLRKEIGSLSSAPEQIPPAMAAEKQALQTEVAGLEQQLATLQSSVSESSQVLDKKRNLMNEIMKMDADNQDLRQKINDLTDKLQSLQK